MFKSPSHGTEQQQQRLFSAAVTTSQLSPPPLPQLRHLSPLEHATVSRILHDQRIWEGNSGTIIGAYRTTIGFGTQTLTLGKLESLRPGLWLNDECINSYMALLNTRDLARATPLGARRRYCYTTFFMTKLLQTGSPWEGQADYQAVKKWNRRFAPDFNIFALELALFPINVNMDHWVCIVADMSNCTLRVYDSLDNRGDAGHHYLDHVRSYLAQEHQHRFSGVPLPAAWRMVTGPGAVAPQQPNNTDCGMYTCAFADCITRGQAPHFKPDQIPGLRDHIALHLIQGSVPPWQEPFLLAPLSFQQQ